MTHTYDTHDTYTHMHTRTHAHIHTNAHTHTHTNYSMEINLPQNTVTNQYGDKWFITLI